MSETTTVEQPDTGPWLTVEEAALRMKCCVKTVRLKLARKEITGYRPSGRRGKLLFDADEIDRHVRKHRVG